MRGDFCAQKAPAASASQREQKPRLHLFLCVVLLNAAVPFAVHNACGEVVMIVIPSFLNRPTLSYKAPAVYDASHGEKLNRVAVMQTVFPNPLRAAPSTSPQATAQ